MGRESAESATGNNDSNDITKRKPLYYPYLLGELMNDSPAIKRDSPEFRSVCEARLVLQMDRARRNKYYDGVLRHRKQKGLDALLAAVSKEDRAQSREMER